jgi:hypothetical protein
MQTNHQHAFVTDPCLLCHQPVKPFSHTSLSNLVLAVYKADDKQFTLVGAYSYARVSPRGTYPKWLIQKRIPNLKRQASPLTLQKDQRPA